MKLDHKALFPKLTCLLMPVLSVSLLSVSIQSFANSSMLVPASEHLVLRDIQKDVQAERLKSDVTT